MALVAVLFFLLFTVYSASETVVQNYTLAFSTESSRLVYDGTFIYTVTEDPLWKVWRFRKYEDKQFGLIGYHTVSSPWTGITGVMACGGSIYLLQNGTSEIVRVSISDWAVTNESGSPVLNPPMQDIKYDASTGTSWMLDSKADQLYWALGCGVKSMVKITATVPSVKPFAMFQRSRVMFSNDQIVYWSTTALDPSNYTQIGLGVRDVVVLSHGHVLFANLSRSFWLLKGFLSAPNPTPNPPPDPNPSPNPPPGVSPGPKPHPNPSPNRIVLLCLAVVVALLPLVLTGLCCYTHWQSWRVRLAALALRCKTCCCRHKKKKAAKLHEATLEMLTEKALQGWKAPATPNPTPNPTPGKALTLTQPASPSAPPLSRSPTLSPYLAIQPSP
jgi:hypothetical protein